MADQAVLFKVLLTGRFQLENTASTGGLVEYSLVFNAL